MIKKLFLVIGFLAVTAHSVFAETNQILPGILYKDEHDTTHALTELRGRFVLINLWATWCGPCVREMPSLDALQQRYGGAHLVVLPLTEDHSGASAARGFYERQNIRNLPVAVDPQGVDLSVLRASSLPTSILVDPNGREVFRLTGGYNWMSEKMISDLDRLIGVRN